MTDAARASSRPTSSARFALRDRTSEAHEALDTLMSGFDLGDRLGYGEFLQAQAGAVLPIEAALDRAGAQEVWPEWPGRRRADDLCADLSDMGLAPPPSVDAPSLATEAEILGALYVLEGSRLGGAVLIRSVAQNLPRRFLQPGNPLSWRAFVEVLDLRLGLPGDLDRAARTALNVFGAFDRSARATLGTDRS